MAATGGYREVTGNVSLIHGLDRCSESMPLILEHV